MKNLLFTATGCTRCKIVKNFMDEKGISFIEKDMRSDGKEEFQSFYKANRSSIYRGPDGIEFPIFTDGTQIRQGIGATIAYLHSGSKLDGFFSVGNLHREWVNGIHISGGNPQWTQDFLAVLRYLKSHNLKLQLDTNGKNSDILQQVLNEGLAQVMIMNVLGPRSLYSRILGEEIDFSEVEKSIWLLPRFPDYKFQTTVVPVRREDEEEETGYLTPEEIGETARLIEELTGSKKNPYLIKLFNPDTIEDERLKTIEPLAPSLLFKYRTAARPYQVFTEVEKG
ncbi:MAG TPA: hypothetical protein GX711_02960 [Clostridia bacterium]|jgi:glutaredoxin|nr:hypothetical protein [Clostridia bacterium]